ERPHIEEYIILTTDTDFIALIEKLSERSKRTVAAANEKNVSMSLYLDHADIVIPMFVFKEAMAYERPSSWIKNALEQPRAVARRLSQAIRNLRANGKPADVINGPPHLETASRILPAKNRDLAVAAEQLAEIAKRTPGLAIGRKTVLRTITKRVPAFKTG